MVVAVGICGDAALSAVSDAVAKTNSCFCTSTFCAAAATVLFEMRTWH
jgi:hypothetical protein